MPLIENECQYYYLCRGCFVYWFSGISSGLFLRQNTEAKIIKLHGEIYKPKLAFLSLSPYKQDPKSPSSKCCSKINLATVLIKKRSLSTKWKLVHLVHRTVILELCEV